MALAHLALTVALLAPQDAQSSDPLQSTALTITEQKKLSSLAKKWFGAWRKWDDSEPNSRARLRANKALSSAKAKFMKEWQAKEKKEPIAHMGDLLAIFDNVFPYDKQSSSSELKTISPSDIDPFAILAPKGYKQTERYPCVMVIPDRKDGSWLGEKDHYAKTWGSAEKASDFLFYFPLLKKRKGGDIELDPLPDLSSDSGNSQEFAAIAAVLRPAGEAQRLYRMDRNRLVLDCGVGSSGFGLRMATYFPARFAGLILRHPVDFGDLRLGSLTGIPVLLVESEETKSACERIQTKLNELQPGSCQTLKADDPVLPDKIAQWASEVERKLYRNKVVFAPNHDRFSKAFWVQASLAESIYAGLEPDEMPYVEAVADRDANRITVKTKNISALLLYLNDSLLDLNKEFTIVLNGKAVTEKRQRNFYDMTEWMFGQFDPNVIWTSHYQTAVEKTEPSGSKSDGSDGEK